MTEIFYSIVENSETGEREVVVTERVITNGELMEHGQGTFGIDDPSLPEWIKDPDLIFDNYAENGVRIVPGELQ